VGVAIYKREFSRYVHNWVLYNEEAGRAMCARWRLIRCQMCVGGRKMGSRLTVNVS